MKTEIKDVIHFYLGCNVMHLDKVFKIIAIDTKGNFLFEGCNDTNWIHHTACKLILRPLPDMTVEEKVDFTTLPIYPDVPGLWNISRQRGEETLLLAKLGFDVFALIESGQAIDSKTLKELNS